MANEPWKTDKWFSSPWNYVPEVTEGFKIPDNVQVHDVTLRDGEQQAGVEFSADDKLRIAEALAGAGIHRIEAGLPAVSPSDKEAIDRIVAEDLPAELESRSSAAKARITNKVSKSRETGLPAGRFSPVFAPLVGDFHITTSKVDSLEYGAAESRCV